MKLVERDHAANADAFTAFGLARPDAQAIYVIWPDGYVGWRRRGLDLDACRLFLDRMLGPSATDVPSRDRGGTERVPAVV